MNLVLSTLTTVQYVSHGMTHATTPIRHLAPSMRRLPGLVGGAARGSVRGKLPVGFAVRGRGWFGCRAPALRCWFLHNITAGSNEQ